MKQSEILDIFKKTGAILEGHFVLSSGLHSPQYLQCALVLQNPQYAEKLCKALAEQFNRPTVVVAPALGGVIVSYEVARVLGIKGIFTERENGKMILRRGFSLSKNDRVLVVEDVITTGLSTKEVIDVVKSCGAKVVGVGSIVNRAKEKIDFGVESKSLINLDIPTFKPEECPLCKRNIPLTKPGSRI
jgi:orotate phosphoribosyltransferase